MFSYTTPNFIKRIDTKKLSAFFTIIYVLGLIPMLILAFYDWPSADDFSMALQTHQAYVGTGSFFAAIAASLQKSWWVYTNYVGYYFSTILTDICPSVFGEKFYFITPILMIGMLTFGVCYFFDALFVRVWKMDPHLTNIARMITLLLMVQSMPKGSVRVEAFYWYSGAVNYTFTFGMALFWIGLLLRSVYDDDAKSRKRKIIQASFWGFWLGGSNYMTALELSIISVIILFLFFMIKKGIFTLDGADEGKQKSFGYIWIAALTNLIGFACSCLTPGNTSRNAITSHVNPLRAVMLSVYSVYDLLINSMTRWEVLAAMALLIPVFWLMGGALKHKLEHPVLFPLFSFLLVSSNVTPCYYAVGNIEAGRIQALFWMEYIVMLTLTVFYLTVWARQRMDGEAPFDKFTYNQSILLVICIAFMIAGAVLSVIANARYFCATSAAYDLISGNAAEYKAENEERLNVLLDDSVRDAVLKEHQSQPELLFYLDVTPDSGEWINTTTAIYYEKDSVVIY